MANPRLVSSIRSLRDIHIAISPGRLGSRGVGVEWTAPPVLDGAPIHCRVKNYVLGLIGSLYMSPACKQSIGKTSSIRTRVLICTEYLRGISCRPIAVSVAAIRGYPLENRQPGRYVAPHSHLASLASKSSSSMYVTARLGYSTNPRGVASDTYTPWDCVRTETWKSGCTRSGTARTYKPARTRAVLSNRVSYLNRYTH